MIAVLRMSLNKRGALWLPPLFTLMLARLCQVRHSVSLCEVKTHSYTLGKTHCFFFLNSSLHSGCAVNEGKDVCFMMEIAEPIPRRSRFGLNIVQKQVLRKWEEKSIHCCKNLHEGSLKASKLCPSSPEGETSVLLWRGEESASRLPFIERHNTQG